MTILLASAIVLGLAKLCTGIRFWASLQDGAAHVRAFGWALGEAWVGAVERFKNRWPEYLEKARRG